jgi:hypothetical protein
MFNKASEVIPLRHFTDGIFTPDGRCIVAPLGKGKRQTIKILNGLKKKDMLSYKSIQGMQTRYWLNLNPEMQLIASKEIEDIKWHR